MSYIKVEIFIPEKNVEELMNKINSLGVLKDNNYDYSFSETKVVGNFRPLLGANPTIGEIGRRERINESKIEFRIEESALKEVNETILRHHPYEVPVINYIRLFEVL